MLGRPVWKLLIWTRLEFLEAIKYNSISGDRDIQLKLANDSEDLIQAQGLGFVTFVTVRPTVGLPRGGTTECGQTMSSDLMRKQVQQYQWAKGQSAQQPPSAKETALAAQGNSCSSQRQMVTIFLGQCKVEKVRGEQSSKTRQPQ